jgi:uncharacterized membrane protein
MMTPLQIPSYIADYLPYLITDYLQGYTTDHFPHHIKDSLPQNIGDCNKVLDTIQNTCVPLSSVVTAIIIYSAIALLLSWYAELEISETQVTQE